MDHIEPIPRGRGVGGSSLINAMMYVRGNKKDFDKWGRLNPGWSYRSVLPYFIKSENTTVYPQDYAYHGHNGELHTETRNFQSPVTTAFLSAVQESGYHIQDYNGKNQIVFSPTQFTTENGRRCSGDKAFIRPIRTRNNLKILTNSYVVKIDMKDKKARGVKYVNDGKQYCARAEKEVILSAGVIKSPHLLMLSGIGPKEHLKSLGIEVIKDLPVGKNLWDHLVSSLLTFTINYTFPEFDQRTLLEDYLKGHGLFTLPMAIEALGFTNINGRDVSVPDLEYIFLATKAPNDSLQQFQKLTNYNEDVYNKVVKKLAGQAFWRMYSLLLYPKSRGTVTLRSNDPYDYLNIDPNYFSDPDSYDLNTLAASVEHTLKLAESKPMQSFNSQPLKIDLLNCPSSGFGTKEYNKCFMKNTARTLHHFSGTCKMGPFWDKTAVVGHDSKVHGIKGLRVADTSIIPCPTGGHTNAIAYMIGEKISDEIKRYWGAL